jgi:hypothetical protein
VVFGGDEKVLMQERKYAKVVCLFSCIDSPSNIWILGAFCAKKRAKGVFIEKERVQSILIGNAK